MVQCSFTPCYVSNYFISDQFIMSNKNYKLFCLCSGLKVEPDLVLHRSFGFCPNYLDPPPNLDHLNAYVQKQLGRGLPLPPHPQIDPIYSL